MLSEFKKHCDNNDLYHVIKYINDTHIIDPLDDIYGDSSHYAATLLCAMASVDMYDGVVYLIQYLRKNGINEITIDNYLLFTISEMVLINKSKLAYTIYSLRIRTNTMECNMMALPDIGNFIRFNINYVKLFTFNHHIALHYYYGTITDGTMKHLASIGMFIRENSANNTAMILF